MSASSAAGAGRYVSSEVAVGTGSVTVQEGGMGTAAGPPARREIEEGRANVNAARVVRMMVEVNMLNFIVISRVVAG